MNLIQKFANSIKKERVSNETEVLIFSDKVSSLIQLRPNDLEKPYTFGKWKIVSNVRRLNDDWYDLFEIIPAEYEDNLGYSNSENPDWVEVKGTRSAILMPEKMRNQFIADLIEHLKA